MRPLVDLLLVGRAFLGSLLLSSITAVLLRGLSCVVLHLELAGGDVLDGEGSVLEDLAGDELEGVSGALYSAVVEASEEVEDDAL